MTDTSTDPRHDFMWRLVRWHERTYGTARVPEHRVREYISTWTHDEVHAFATDYALWYMNQRPDLVRRYSDAPSDSVRRAVLRLVIADSVAGAGAAPRLVLDRHTDDMPWLRYQSSFCLPHEQADHEARLAADPDVRLVWRVPPDPDDAEDDVGYAVGVRHDRDYDYSPGHYPTEAALVEHFPNNVHPRHGASTTGRDGAP